VDVEHPSDFLELSRRGLLLGYHCH
jgi:hypothetical protein